MSNKSIDSKLTITVHGRAEHGEEHRTTIQNACGEQIEYYTDGYDGVSYQDIARILDFAGVKYFTVYKKYIY